jgi:hypothetical protein
MLYVRIMLEVLMATIFLMAASATVFLTKRSVGGADTGATLGAMCFCVLLAYLSFRAFWGLGNRKESGRRVTQACLILLSGILCYAGLDYGHPFDAPRRVDWRPLLVAAVFLSIAAYLSLSKAAKKYLTPSDGGGQRNGTGSRA